jgi:predicted esterase
MRTAPAVGPYQQLGFEHVFERGFEANTILLLHSTGGDEHQLVALGRQLAPGASLLSPRGKVLESGTVRRFFARRSPLELDIPDLLTRTDELARFVESAVAAYELDPARVTALGYSNGANIALSVLLRHPGLLSGAALWRPGLPYEPELPPALDGTHVLLASGVHDPFTTPAATQRLAALLREAGADLTVELSESGHEVLESDIDATHRWLQGVLGADER